MVIGFGDVVHSIIVDCSKEYKASCIAYQLGHRSVTFSQWRASCLVEYMCRQLVWIIEIDTDQWSLNCRSYTTMTINCYDRLLVEIASHQLVRRHLSWFGPLTVTSGTHLLCVCWMCCSDNWPSCDQLCVCRQMPFDLLYLLTLYSFL